MSVFTLLDITGFSEFKRTMGAAGTAWYHIVGQTSSYLQIFDAEVIHDTGNLVSLEQLIYQLTNPVEHRTSLHA